MSKPRDDEQRRRGPALEGLSFRVNEDRPVARQKPYWLTYLGDGVVRVDEVGLFQHKTSANVDRAVATAYAGRDDWRVTDLDGELVDPADDRSSASD